MIKINLPSIIFILLIIGTIYWIYYELEDTKKLSGLLYFLIFISILSVVLSLYLL